MTNMPSKHVKDYTGQAYGDLVALSFIGLQQDHSRVAVWLWQCKCGKTFERAARIVLGTIRKGSIPACAVCSQQRRGKHYEEEGRANRNQVVLQYKYSAKKRGFVWDLTDEEVDQIFVSNCHYCGSPPSNCNDSLPSGEFIYQGMDRINNELGYVSGNVVPCCKDCNLAKRDRSYENFVGWLVRVATHLGT